MRIRVLDEAFELLPERVLYWPRQNLLAVADLHLGKAEVFQRQGLWLPNDAHFDDLKVLKEVVRRFSIEHVVFLGDLVHHGPSISARMQTAFAGWASQTAAKVTVLLGNHDRGLDNNWPVEWAGISRAHHVQIDRFVFQHELPRPDDSRFTWCGHIHPVYTVADGSDRLRLPCFLLKKNFGILPAFSRLAGGYDWARKAGEVLYAVTPSRVFQI